MPYQGLQRLSVLEFKRLCGVSRETFAQIVEELRSHLERQGKRGGQNKLSVEDQLLVALEYWREYRTQFHIAVSWELHETTVGRIIRKVEVVATSTDNGRTHDFKVLKRSRLPFVSSQLCLDDRGYQCFAKRHTGACTPITN